jgi:ribonuclease HI
VKQLELFQECYPPAAKKDKETIRWKLFIDGASRKNPGKAGAGIYILKEEEPVSKRGFALGVRTNNQAEYLALLLGIYLVKKMMHPEDSLYIFSDSELLVKQISGIYRVRNLELQPLYVCALHLLDDIKYHCCHIMREQNSIADEMANQGIDKQTAVPHEFIKLMQEYAISF